MNITIYQGLSVAIFIAHSLGFILLLWGAWRLLRGVRGEGQSAEGVAALRGALLKLLQPVIWGALALSALLALTFYERSPLTGWIQVIAPLSTVIWVLWSHFSARRVNPGEMFEALVPLAPKAQDDDPLTRALREKAQTWSDQAHPLSGRALTQTALRAVDDAREVQGDTDSLSLDDLLIILRDALADTHHACQRFPLGQQLTLADWIFEGERLSEIWGSGLRWIDRGRALVNPFTLLDNKRLWGWAKGKPGPLFQRELSAWLHHGLYLLVVRRLHERSQARSDPQSASRSKRLEAPLEVSADAPPLWRLLTRKLTVPFWLYWALGSLAVTLNHPIIGGALTVLSGALLWVSLDHATSIRRWRESLGALGASRRASRADDAALNEAVTDILKARVQTLREGVTSRPCSSMLTFAQEAGLEVAMVYRRDEHPRPPLALLNATIVDALFTAELICDDLVKWRASDGILSKIIWVLSKFGVSDQRVEGLLLESARSWAQGASDDEPHDDISTSEETTHGEAAQLSVAERAERADLWLEREVAGLNFLLRKPAELAIAKIVPLVSDWLCEELIERVIPLYQGAVGAEVNSVSFASITARLDDSSEPEEV